MAWGKKVTELNDNGAVVSYKLTRAMKKSERRLIPATPAPKTQWQKFKRDAWG